MTIDLENARAAFRPAPERSFDPTRISQAIKKAGFTPGEVEVTAVGTLSGEKDRLQLAMAGPVPILVLAGGTKEEELREREDLLGQQLRVTGKLHPSHADQAPGITVEHWEPVNLDD